MRTRSLNGIFSVDSALAPNIASYVTNENVAPVEIAGENATVVSIMFKILS